MKDKTDSSIKFKFYFKANSKGNVICNLPYDLEEFLVVADGPMETIIENLAPDQYYTIEISIKSAK